MNMKQSLTMKLRVRLLMPRFNQGAPYLITRTVHDLSLTPEKL